MCLRWVPALAWASLAFLTACQATPPPTVEAALPLPVPAPPPPPQRPTQGSWKFVSKDHCKAQIQSAQISIDLQVTNHTTSFTIHPVRAASHKVAKSTAIRYAGSAGSWAMPAKSMRNGKIIAQNPLSEEQASRILFLLEGGLLKVGRDTDGLFAIRIGSAGEEGRVWFECVRQQMVL